MHRPARYAPEPVRAEAAFTVEKRWAHDAVARAAGGEGPLAGQLGAEESAARTIVQSERRDVDEPDGAPRAGRGERAGRKVMHALVSLCAALAQDADSVHRRIDSRQDGLPAFRGSENLKMHFAALAAVQARWEAPGGAARPPGADHHRVAARRERRGDMPADESAAAQDQDLHIVFC